MKNLFFEQSNEVSGDFLGNGQTIHTPEICFNKNTGILVIRGLFYISDDWLFNTLTSWLKEYFKHPATQTKVIICLLRMNKFATKWIYNLMSVIERESHKKNVEVFWYADSESKIELWKQNGQLTELFINYVLKENIELPGSPKTPNLFLDYYMGFIKVEGRISIRNEMTFFNSISEWFEFYTKILDCKTIVEISCEYISPDSKFFMLLFNLLKKLTIAGHKVKVAWIYCNDEMCELGEKYEATHDSFQFEFFNDNP